MRRGTKDHTLTVKKETLRNLDRRLLSADQLAQVGGGGGTWYPKVSKSCCC